MLWLDPNSINDTDDVYILETVFFPLFQGGNDADFQRITDIYTYIKSESSYFI